MVAGESATYCRCGPFRVRFFPPGLVRPLLLKLLGEGPKTGFTLMKEVAQRTDGQWAPGPATIYPALRELGEGGFVRRAPGGPGLPRAYSLTSKGRRAVEEWEEMKRSGRNELRSLVRLWERI